MKLKAYHQGMNSKLFLGLWFVLFAAWIILINWLFTRPFHQINALDSKLVTTEKQITNLKAINAEFLLELNKGDYLFIHTEITAERDAKTFIGILKQDLEYYRGLRYLNRKSGISASLDELSLAVSGVEKHLNEYFLISRERGSLNSGLISRWQALSGRMIANANSAGPVVMYNLSLIKQSEYNYLLQKDPRILERISALCEEVRNMILTNEGGIDVADLDSYVSLTGNLISIDKRIGSADTRGIVADLTMSLNKSQALFDITGMMINEAVAKQDLRLALYQYGLTLLIVALFIYLFILISRNMVFRPLKQLAGFAQKLADGALPEDTIAAGKLSEMKSIKDSLMKVVLLLKEKISIARALNEKRHYSEQILAGENDLLGREMMDLQQMIIATTEMQMKNEEEALKRRFINEGLARFSEIMRSRSNDINDLGDAFIKEMVKYLNAIQGGFFIYDESEKAKPILRMVSAFAYNRKKYLQQSIPFGEGLVGTCAREKQSINLTEIPAGYISITSGLGETLPDNLLLVPVLHEEILIGVLEIASMNKFKDFEITFSEEVARSLGSTIIYTRNNQRTAELLAKSQQQALEMAEQEEEMRQNMEELKATQEESGRREEEYKGIVEAIDQTLFTIEYDINGTIRSVNEKFCIFLGRSGDEIIGRLHHEIFDGTLRPDAHFWDELQRSQHLTFSERIKVGQKTYLLKEHFTIVHNSDGILVKYINFVTDDRAGNS